MVKWWLYGRFKYYINILWAWGLMVRVVYTIWVRSQVWTRYSKGGYLRGALNEGVDIRGMEWGCYA